MCVWVCVFKHVRIDLVRMHVGRVLHFHCMHTRMCICHTYTHSLSPDLSCTPIPVPPQGTKGSGQVSLLNIITELKKCCNHPFLFESAEDNYRGNNDDSVVDRLVRTSGKMVLLDKLLRRLHQTGHRVLIFSQMVRVLDIISDYMRRRGYAHQRLDGSTPAGVRHQVCGVVCGGGVWCVYNMCGVYATCEVCVSDMCVCNNCSKCFKSHHAPPCLFIY